MRVYQFRHLGTVESRSDYRYRHVRIVHNFVMLRLMHTPNYSDLSST